MLGPTKRIEQMNIWLKNCQEGHERCETFEASLRTPCPTRLIDVSQQTPRIVCHPREAKVRYVALSHCWGRKPPIKLTKENQHRYSTAIDPTALPKTYNDAIWVTREVGIPYLWIDSLCIVQDDPADWEQEAAAMTSVYEGAQITIAAAWSEDADSGLFHDYKPAMVIEVAEETRINESFEKSTVQLSLRSVPNDEKEIGSAPLNLRAWALQEFVLSRRIIILAKEQIYWLCSCLYESEDGIESSTNLQFAPLPRLGVISRQLNVSQHELYKGWQDTVLQYSKRSLTFPHDKIAALAGVTRLFQRLVKDEPLAGLWKNDLFCGLLWSSEVHSTLDDEAIQSLKIPSWSWLSIYGGVRPTGSVDTPCIGVSSASVTWSNTPLTSPICSASIVGHGRFLRVQELRKSNYGTCFCIPGKICIEGDVAQKNFCDIDRCTTELTGDISALPVTDRYDGIHLQLNALLVESIQSLSSRPTYRRIGKVVVGDFPKDVYDSILKVDFMLV